MIVRTQIEGTRLAGNLLDDPTERDLFVYLPLGTHGGRANERYRVVLEWLSQNLDGDVP